MALIHTEISGEEFNHLYDKIKFYKFLKNDLVHHDFQYQLGFNGDCVPFNPTGECSKG